ncbi:MAG: DUF2100 domain-containing protein [Candidatus Helarchaeota archaeon]|nr:DUF2100 domain-containing protein [Candidatus Helarchaeota archaeon]
MSNSDFSRINEAIDLLIDIKNIFRKNTPTFTMNEKYSQRVKDILIKLNKTLAVLNENFGIKSRIEQDKKSDFKENIKNLFLIVNSPKNRKKLIDLGFNPAQILSTGGPIHVSDIKSLNPNISEPALRNIQNKIQKFWKVLKSKLNQGNFNKLILLLEESNIADKILFNRKDEFEKKLSLSIQGVTISSFDRIDNDFLSLINS